MSDQQDLTESLALAAAEAVRKRRPVIEAGGVRNLQGITIEIQPTELGAVMTCETYISWRDVIRRARKG